MPQYYHRPKKLSFTMAHRSTPKLEDHTHLTNKGKVRATAVKLALGGEIANFPTPQLGASSSLKAKPVALGVK